MYKLQLFLVPVNQPHSINFPPSPSPLAPRAPIILREVLPCEWCERLQCSPFCAGTGPVPITYQEMPQLYEHDSDHYQEPSSGPDRHNRNKKAESPKPYQYKHESLGTNLEDGSIGVALGHAWIDANNKTGSGKVWRIPSKNPLALMTRIDPDLT